MSEKIVQLSEEVIKGQLKELVRGSVEETLNELLEAEPEKLTQAARYERNEQRQGYRIGVGLQGISRNHITGWFHSAGACKPICASLLTVPNKIS